MPIELLALGLIAVAASTIALLSWRKARKILHRLDTMATQREEAEAGKASLLRTLSTRNHDEIERIYRLEHDIKSSLGVILGFSSLLRESLERDPGTSPLVLKNIGAIHQAATKILQTVDSAVKNTDSNSGQEIPVNGKT